MVVKFIEIHEKQKKSGDYLTYFLKVEDIDFVGDLGGSAFIWIGNKSFKCVESYEEVKRLIEE